ncbi:MAG: hypothetical protein U9Q99_00035 [Nanoarchaeota archaeon]|nr:hypothetical protein [Nanoarchaeota archaeon]
MKKTTIKISWDLSQQLTRLASHLSEQKQMRIDKDSVIRYLLNFYEKAPQNALKSKIGVFKK